VTRPNQIVIVGAGTAGLTTAEALRNRDPLRTKEVPLRRTQFAAVSLDTVLAIMIAHPPKPPVSRARHPRRVHPCSGGTQGAA
jgi:hypothetical protein